MNAMNASTRNGKAVTILPKAKPTQKTKPVNATKLLEAVSERAQATQKEKSAQPQGFMLEAVQAKALVEAVKDTNASLKKLRELLTDIAQRAVKEKVTRKEVGKAFATTFGVERPADLDTTLINAWQYVARREGVATSYEEYIAVPDMDIPAVQTLPSQALPRSEAGKVRTKSVIIDIPPASPLAEKKVKDSLATWVAKTDMQEVATTLAKRLTLAQIEDLIDALTDIADEK